MTLLLLECQSASILTSPFNNNLFFFFKLLAVTFILLINKHARKYRMNATINTPLNNRANYDICQVCCLQYCSNTTSQSRLLNVSSDFIRKKSNIFPLIYHTDIQTLVLLGTGLKEDPCHCPFPVNCPISQTIGSQTCILHHFLQSKMMSLSLLVVENCQIVCCSSVSICIVSTYDLNTTRNI